MSAFGMVRDLLAGVGAVVVACAVIMTVLMVYVRRSGRGR